MHSSTTLKNMAKKQMKGRYFKYLGVSLIPSLISSVATTPITLIGNILLYINFARYDVFSYAPIHDGNQIYYDNFDEILFLTNYFKAMIVPMLFITVGSLLISYFLVMPALVGVFRWYVRARESSDINFTLTLSSFKKNKYLKTVATMAFQSLLIFLWSLLFIIPGIIKSYSYRMVPFILADNPQIGVRRAVFLSKKMTHGYKIDMFIVDLSFIGWYILGFMACFIGIVAVIPYHQATFAEVYDSLKKEAVSKNYCTMEELGYEMVN